jgi:hypothetical protein
MIVFMSVGPKPFQSELESVRYTKHNIADATSIVLDINKKKVKIEKSKINDISAGLAEIAFSLGETNDPDGFEEMVSEDLFAALKKVRERQQKKKN